MTNATHKHSKREFDAGHVPISEEFDSPRRTLPAALPLAIALVVVVVFIVGVAYIFRSKPVAQGRILSVFLAQKKEPPKKDEPAAMSMLAIQISLKAVGNKPLYIKDITADLTTGGNSYSDDAASPSDWDRYFQAYPDLRDHAMKPVAVEDKIPPGTEERGTVVVTFPVDQGQFDARKSLTVTVQPYDEKPIVLKEAER